MAKRHSPLNIVHRNFHVAALRKHLGDAGFHWHWAMVAAQDHQRIWPSYLQLQAKASTQQASGGELPTGWAIARALHACKAVETVYVK
jgi:hypothetical protein